MIWGLAGHFLLLSILGLSVGYASDRMVSLSPTPLTVPNGVDGVGDR
jgi:hypothetical protein